MGAAEVIAFEEVCVREQWDTLRQQLTGGLTETSVAHVHRGDHDCKQLPYCIWDKVLQVRERVCRTVATLVSPIQFERPYVYYRSCRFGSYPSDEALGVVAGCKQRDRHKAAANVVTEVSADTAQSLLRELTGGPFGSVRMYTVAHHMAEGLKMNVP